MGAAVPRNWHQIAGSHDYWAAATASSAFTHLWSLAIEEQFYVIWPLVVWAVLRRRRARHGSRLLAGITVTGIVLSIAALVSRYDAANPTRTYLGTDTRASSLLLGALVALLPEIGRAHV